MFAKKDELLIMPLGGLEQVGANSTMIGHDKEWIMVDLGISFYDKYGIEILVPDVSYPAKMRDSLKGIFVTHAHEDHIGSIHYLWEQLKCPIYLTEFPAAVLRQKFSETENRDKVPIHIVEPSEPFDVGSFKTEFVPLAHSVVGSCGIYIKTSAGNIFCTGDWKIDETPLIGDKIDTKRMEKIGKDGVDCLLCDSTNVMNDENIGSETDVKNGLIKVFKQHKNKRITITCFASNLARIETILSVARKEGRKIAIVGRSMHRMIDAVSKTTYFSKNFKAGLSSIVDENEAVDMPPHKVAIICTGSQGESRSALYKIARGENKIVKLGDKDVVVFSSKIIPGNELGIRELQNLLIKRGVEIVTSDTHKDIHVSGHPNKEAISMMYKWTKPKSLIPIHGDPYMLHEHQKFALKNGISEVLIAESGDIISLKNRKLQKIGREDVVLNCIDGKDIVEINGKTIKERAIMSHNGHVGVSFIIDRNDNLMNAPDIVVSGIYITRELENKVRTLIYQIVTNEVSLYANTDIDSLKERVKHSVKRLMSKYFSKKPHVSVHIHKV